MVLTSFNPYCLPKNFTAIFSSCNTQSFGSKKSIISLWSKWVETSQGLSSLTLVYCVHPLWDSATVVEVHLLERLCKVLVSYHLNIHHNHCYLQNNYGHRRVHFCLLCSWSIQHSYTCPSESGGERNILDINLSFLPHNWTNSLYPRFAAKVHVYSSIFNFAPQNFRSPGFYLHHPQGCS